MKLNFMKDEALTYFKANIEANLENYLSPDNRWVGDKYQAYKNDTISPFGNFKFEVPDFKLNMENEKPEQTDIENVKILYSALKDISDTQASDERFWVGLAHTAFWDYMQYRCKINDGNLTKNKILSNFFFNYGQKRSLIVHPLARLWWVGRLTYDANAKNPYKSLEYLKIDFPTKVLTLFSSNFSNNSNVTRAILNAITEIQQSDNKVGRKEYFEILRYVNFLGGVIILDYLSEDELRDKIISHYYNVNKETISV